MIDEATLLRHLALAQAGIYRASLAPSCLVTFTTAPDASATACAPDVEQGAPAPGV